MRVVPAREGVSRPPPAARSPPPRSFGVPRLQHLGSPKNVRETQAAASVAGTGGWEALSVRGSDKQVDWTWPQIMKSPWVFLAYWLRLIVIVLPLGLPFFVPSMPKHDTDRSDTGAWRDRIVIWWLLATTAVGLTVFADSISYWCTFSGGYLLATTRIVCMFVLVVAIATLAIDRRRWKILAKALVFCTVFVPALQLLKYVGWWPSSVDFLPDVLFGADPGTAKFRGQVTVVNVSMLHIAIKALQVLPYHVHMPLAMLSFSLAALMQCAVTHNDNELNLRFAWTVLKQMSTATLILVLHERESRFQRLQSIELDRLAEREKHFLSFLARGIDGPLGRIIAFLRHLDDPPGRFNELLQDLQAQERESFGSWPLREHQEDATKDVTSASAELVAMDDSLAHLVATSTALDDNAAKVAEQNVQGDTPSDILGASDAQLKHMLTHVQHSTTVIVDTVHNCRKLQSIDSGTYEPQRDIIDLRELVESCLGMHSREREAGLGLKLLIDEPMVIVSDRRLWLHVLMNLIGNAVKFTGAEVGTPCSSRATKQPSVTVSISRAHYQSCVTVDVIDNGPGIAAGDQERIFGKYSQACRGFGPQGLGTGLGLYLSTKIVKLMRGQLRLCSPIEADRGSKFTFTVPCEIAAANAMPSHDVLGEDRPEIVSGISALLLARRSLQLHVLLVEDDDLNVLLLTTALKKGFSEHHGAQIVITRTRTAEEALTLIGGATPRKSKASEQSMHSPCDEGQESPYCIFDAIIIDQHLEPAGGVMKGSQLAQHIKSRHRTHPPCVVLVSGNSDMLTERDIFFECGASVVWNKPYPTPQAMVHDLTVHLRIRAGVSLAKTDQLPQRSALAAYSSSSASMVEGVVAASSSHIDDAPHASVGVSGQGDADDEANADSHAEAQRPVASRCCAERLARGFWRMAMPFPDLPPREMVAKRWQIAYMHDRDFVRAATIVELVVGIALQCEGPIIANRQRGWILFLMGISAHVYLTWNPKRWHWACHLAGFVLFGITVHRVHVSMDMCKDMHDPRHRNVDSKVTCEAYNNADINFDSVQMLFLYNAAFIFFRVFSFRVHVMWLAACCTACFIGAIVHTSNYAVLQDRHSSTVILFRQVLQLVWMLLMIMSSFLIAIVIHRSWVFHFVNWQRKQRALEQERALISFLCHEIKNPVSAIRFFVTKLDVRLRRVWDTRGASNLRELRAMMPRVMTATTSIVNIVQHCHELAQIESGSFTVVHEPVDLYQIATATRKAEMEEHESRISIVLGCEDGESLCVVGDRCLWSHAMRDMISNAVDQTLGGPRDAMEPHPATAADGGIKHAPQDPGDKPVIKMQLSCSALDGDAHGAVNMRVRFTECDREHGGRSNMRLHTLRKVAQLQGGELHVTYPASRRGSSSFTSRGGSSLPLAPNEGELSLVVPCEFTDAATAKLGANATEGKAVVRGDDWQIPCKLNVLIVEDDNLNVIVMKTCLATGFRKQFGVEIVVSHATTAEAALKIINEQRQHCPFEIVIIDQHMEPAGGVMKGAQLVHDLNLRPYEQPPVLVLASGNSDNPSERTHFLACGASVVWSKPYPEPADMVDDLVTAMRAVTPPLKQK